MLAFLIQALSAIIGGVAGYAVGAAMKVGITGWGAIHADWLLAAAGVAVGYVIGRILSPKSGRYESGPEDEPND